MSLKIVHIADTHLGAIGNASRLTKDGFNQREQDFCDSFQQAIDQIIIIKPEILLHAGDLFHSSRPHNRIIDFALREFERLSDAKIPSLIISGNHDHARIRSHGSVLKVLDIIPDVKIVTNQQLEIIEYSNMVICALPFIAREEDFNLAMEQLEKYQPSGKTDILLAHGEVADLPEFSYGIGQNNFYLPIERLQEKFSYIALGHYHSRKRLSYNCYYSGATERLTTAEAGESKGFLEVVLADKPEYKFHPLNIRSMNQLADIDAEILNVEEIFRLLEKEVVDVNRSQEIVSLIIKNISTEIYNELSMTKLREFKEHCFDLRIKLERLGKEKDGRHHEEIHSLEKEFVEYLKTLDLSKKQKESLTKRGLEYLSQTE